MLHRKHEYLLSDFKNMVIKQLLLNKKNIFYGGGPPLAPSNGGKQENEHPMTTHDPHFFILKSIQTIKRRMFTKKLDQKILFFGQMVSILCKEHFLG